MCAEQQNSMLAALLISKSFDSYQILLHIAYRETATFINLGFVHESIQFWHCATRGIYHLRISLEISNL